MNKLVNKKQSKHNLKTKISNIFNKYIHKNKTTKTSTTNEAGLKHKETTEA